MPTSTTSRKGAVKFINKDHSLFFTTVKKRVDEYFLNKKISKLGDNKLFLKNNYPFADVLRTFSGDGSLISGLAC